MCLSGGRYLQVSVEDLSTGGPASYRQLHSISSALYTFISRCHTSENCVNAMCRFQTVLFRDSDQLSTPSLNVTGSYFHFLSYFLHIFYFIWFSLLMWNQKLQRANCVQLGMNLPSFESQLCLLFMDLDRYTLCLSFHTCKMAWRTWPGP